MKKLFYSLFIAAAMVACGDDGGEDVVVVEQSTDIPASSFTLESPETNTFAWTEGARISLFRSNTNERFAYDAAGDVFKKEDKLQTGEPFENIYGVYPYKGTNRVTNGDIKTEIPNAQTYSAEGVNFADAPMVGMSASAASPAMELKNLCGVAAIKLYGSAVVKSVAITGNNGEVLAGTAMAEIGEDGEPTLEIVALANNTVTLTAEEPVALGATAEEATSFYLLVPPTTFEAGFIVTVIDSYGNVRKKNFKVDEENPAASIGRNEVVTVAEYELAEKKPVQTILDVQFNEDGTAADEGIYGMDVVYNGDVTSVVSVYKHAKFKENNIARFGHIAFDAGKNYGYYKVDYSANEEMIATIADGFALEVVTLHPLWNWGRFASPVSTDAFRLMRKGMADGNPWTFTYNNGAGWWPGNVTNINTTLEKNKYLHTVYMYDADNMQIQIYQDGVLAGLAENVAEFMPGKELIIGGALDNGNGLFMQWNGEVALVKMYDQALTPDEIATKFNDLKLPEASGEPASPALSTPLLDVKFNENKTAENVGSMSSLVVKSAAEMSHNMDNTDMINVDGFGWVPFFKTNPHNGDSWDNWYRIDYTDNQEFKDKLNDGFTAEILCFHDGNPGDFYVRPISADKWCVHLRCDGGGHHHWWQTCLNADNGHWSQWGNQYDGWDQVFNADQGKVMESYAHVVLVWDPSVGEMGTFVDGNFSVGAKTNFNVGNILNICGMPHRDGQAQHGWKGKVAMVRIYDEAMTQEQVLDRYEALQPTIEKLNATIGQ